MTILTDFVTLAAASLLAVAAAALLDWLGLRAAFVLMQPATARRVAAARLGVRAARLARGFDLWR